MRSNEIDGIDACRHFSAETTFSFLKQVTTRDASSQGHHRPTLTVSIFSIFLFEVKIQSFFCFFEFRIRDESAQERVSETCVRTSREVCSRCMFVLY